MRMTLPELVLLIPQAKSEGNQREMLTHAATFSEGLEIIHETIGCTEVEKKPTLSYKLSSATQKSEAINLASESDWQGCLEEVAQAQAKKKETVAVKILVTEQVGARRSHLVHFA